MKRMQGLIVVELSVGTEANAPLPSEFRIFKLGENPTSKGTFVMDRGDMAAIMSTYAAGGVDLPIDLEHESLDEVAVRADMKDARGWAKLEAREDGIYAVGVTWTADGAERLRSKKQRYISPVFGHTDQMHIRDILNLALTALPATHDAPALVAASRGADPSSEIDLLTEVEGILGLAHYPWDQCMADQVARGHSQDSAQRICGAIKRENAARVLGALRTRMAAADPPVEALARALACKADRATITSAITDRLAHLAELSAADRAKAYIRRIR